MNDVIRSFTAPFWGLAAFESRYAILDTIPECNANNTSKIGSFNMQNVDYCLIHVKLHVKLHVTIYFKARSNLIKQGFFLVFFVFLFFL